MKRLKPETTKNFMYVGLIILAVSIPFILIIPAIPINCIQDVIITDDLEEMDLDTGANETIGNVTVVDVEIVEYSLLQLGSNIRYKFERSTLSIPGISTIDQVETVYFYERLLGDPTTSIENQKGLEGIALNSILGEYHEYLTTAEAHDFLYDENGTPRIYSIRVTSPVEIRYLLMKSFDGYWCFGELRDGYPQYSTLSAEALEARIQEAIDSGKLLTGTSFDTSLISR